MNAINVISLFRVSLNKIRRHIHSNQQHCRTLREDMVVTINTAIRPAAIESNDAIPRIAIYFQGIAGIRQVE